MFNPIATYRIQFHKDFTLSKLKKIIPYLHKLGISTIYASPIFEATPGSSHGYDVTDPNKINPEIGSRADLEKIAKKLRKRGMFWLQDIVPNHMAYHQNNAWLMDFLEKGRQSEYRYFFDQYLADERLFEGPIMVPFLGDSLEKVLEKKEIKVRFNHGKLGIKYFDLILPLHLRSYKKVFSSHTSPKDKAISQLLEQAENTLAIEDPKAYSLAAKELEIQFNLIHEQSEYRKWIKDGLAHVNQNRHLLTTILEEQEYRLCCWKETSHAINFRRFFTVNSLICLNIQNKDVFDRYHRLIRKMLKEDIFQGLRVDHIDGLYDPQAYLTQLRDLVGPETYIVVEKILEAGEPLVSEWPVQGTTGYDFLAQVNNLFTDRHAEKQFTRFYQALSGDKSDYEEQVRQKKRLILEDHMAGELHNLCQLLLYRANTEQEQPPPEQLKTALREFLVHCPVYRYYPGKADQAGQLMDKISAANEDLLPACETIKQALKNDEHFFNRCMQLSGPLMAKGVEDTLMYSNSRFIAHNEVGDSAGTFGSSTKNFHRQMQDRQKHWPLSLNATSTHDTKRGEDVRARLNVLSDLPEKWFKQVEEWRHLNKDLKRENYPDATEEYFIYQTLIGSYPFTDEGGEDYKGRLLDYLKKAFREAKVHSDWAAPDLDFEESVKNFTTGLLDRSRPFWDSFSRMHALVSDFGIINSLSQAMLKYTAPGVPDLYQGCESWDLSLVDPDNRRPVDFKVLQQWLDELQTANFQKLWPDKLSGKLKFWLSHLLLEERTKESETFLHAGYIPLQVKGKYQEHILAFARHYEKHCYIVVIPLHPAKLVETANDLLHFDWQDTQIILPAKMQQRYKNLLLGTYVKTERSLGVNDLLSDIPLALLKAEETKKERSAGILMHITSLPSIFGIGDFGPEARSFADFLNRSKQKYWQVLPLNPTGRANAYSPYSSFSSMAGNTMLISPECLVEEGLLSSEFLGAHILPSQDKVDYSVVEKNKNILYKQAWERFRLKADTTSVFNNFCERESLWLDDFALYTVIKGEYEDKPWHEWPDKLKFHEPKELQSFADQHTESLHYVKWLQFLFFEQWKGLKSYCNSQGTELFGDLPFYVSYDSADVWANPELFKLDERGKPLALAGVPPDYFNEDGQLWGMPVFDWPTLKGQHYAWWVQRIRKNLELFDLLRLDHFRAFSAFWEVPEGELTARNGKWVEGPGQGFFKRLKTELGPLPFVAEDLGDIDKPVYILRNRFHFPGMKVLQFAFGDHIAESDYAPHNHSPHYLVYTGTHDNNTLRGWFKHDINASVKKHLKTYTGIHPDKNNIHEMMIRLAYSSVANTAIIPMQDLLGLGQSARMNRPATLEGNWLWRLKPNQINKAMENDLRNLAKTFRR